MTATRTGAYDGPYVGGGEGHAGVADCAGRDGVSKSTLTVTEEDATGASYTVALDHTADC